VSDDLSGFSLMELFRTEAESQTAILAAGLLALEGSGGSLDAIEPMMRAAHSIKGAARIVGLEAAVKVAHALEDCFVAAQRGGIRIEPHHVDTLLRGVDMLLQISQVADAEAAAWLAKHGKEVDALEQELAAIQAGKAPAPAAPNAAEAVPVKDQSQAAPIEPPARAPIEPLPQAPQEAASQPPSQGVVEQAERVVRVTAESLTHLMGLAGESLIEARRLRPFVDSFLALKGSQTAVSDHLQTLADLFSDGERARAPARGLEVVARMRQEASRSQQLLTEKLEEFEDFARRMEDLSDRLHHEVVSSRLRPLADGLHAFPRLVRDVARQLGKSVRLEIKGEKAGVDRDILEKLDAPLGHLIRNSLDHGIELPAERETAGKPATGTIRVEGRHSAGRLLVVVSDDGRGIDPERLRAKIVERGLASSEMAAQLSEAELLEFLFLPGFTTKEEVTHLSGRGVGLDVVQSMVQAVNGSVRITSQAGKGTSFTLQLPITMSVIRALLVRISGEPYAFPLHRIDRIQVVPKSAMRLIEGRPHFLIDDHPVGLVSATQVLELPPAADAGADWPVVVISDRGHRFGLVVDGFLGERDLQVRPLDPRLGKVADISSASVLDDGAPVLIVDVEDLVRSIDNLLGGRRLRRLDAAPQADLARAVKRILVVDDSITVRELERQLLESHGFLVDTAVDGMDAWNTVRSGHYHLIVSDVDMPRMDGIELTRRIKQDPALRSLPVVIVSYKDREEDRMRGLDAGANCYLTKGSFHDQTFLERIIDLIGEERP
jgi:two-component system, chemotaxis family, sensor histidine kinase and response regulator WspE